MTELIHRNRRTFWRRGRGSRPRRVSKWDTVLFKVVNTTKAVPQIYVRAAEKMNVTVENVLFLDDNLNADQTAKAAGMQVCGVYDESSKDYVEQTKTANDYYICDFQELLHLEASKKA